MGTLGVTLWSMLGHAGIDLGSIWCRSGVDSEWDRFGVDWGSLGGHIWVTFESTWGRLWVRRPTRRLADSSAGIVVAGVRRAPRCRRAHASLQELVGKGLDRATVERIKILLREGSIVASLFGPTALVAVVRTAPLQEAARSPPAARRARSSSKNDCYSCCCAVPSERCDAAAIRLGAMRFARRRPALRAPLPCERAVSIRPESAQSGSTGGA